MSNYIDHYDKNATRFELVSKPLSDSIADEFSTSKAYAVGDFAMYEGSLYKCKTAKAAGAWNAANFELYQIEDALKDAMAVDNTLTVEGMAADAKKTGDEIAGLKGDLEELDEKIDAKEGISNDVKEALLACFDNVAWIGQNGQDYYNALYTALYSESPSTRIVVFNNSAYGRELALDGNYYAQRSSGLTARCRFDPLKNKTDVINVVDADKYNVAIYDFQNNELVDFELKPSTEIITKQGYLMSTSVAPTYVKSVQASGNYFGCAFKKESGVDFTTDEIDNAEGTIFVRGRVSDCVVWDGTVASVDSQKWVNKDAIIGISDPSKLALVAGYGWSARFNDVGSTNGGYPINGNTTVGRAISLTQLLKGDFDGKTVKLSRSQLSTGKNIAFALWYGYLDSDKTFNGSNWVAPGSENEFVYGKWLTGEVTLPMVSSKTGTRIIAIAFKNADANVDFTQAELRELPTLLTIS